MRTRHLGKALVGLVAAAATIGLLGLPAFAHTVTATGVITSGTLTLYASDGTILTTQSLGTTGTGVTCVASSATLTMTDVPHPNSTTGTWTATQTSTTGIQIGTQWFTSVLTITFAPNTTTTWTGTYSGATLTATNTTPGTGGIATAVLRKSTAGAPCTPVAGPCTISVQDIEVTGTHTVNPPPEIAAGDSATVSGGTNSWGDFGFEVAVSGTAGDCGSLIAADDGAVTFANVVITV
jgi:hypothetical protein